MADFSTINEFRKTTQLRKINEDPTYLSFFFLFNFNDREHSPLLSGAASDYLRNVVGEEDRADRLDRFVKLLQKINRELPWFWQSISGLEATRQYGNLEDPWRGAESPKLEIECLENVELTSYALIDLYKRAAYDFNRWVKVIPKNLCHFELTVFVTEVRTFQQTSKAGLLNSKNKDTSNTDIKTAEGKTTNSTNTSMSIDAKPVVVTKLGHCEFDIESTSDLFADLNKSPEMATSKIGIFWHTTEQVNQVYGQNLKANEGDNLVFQKDPKGPDSRIPEFNEYSPFDPTDKDARDKRIEEIKDGIREGFQDRLNNIKDDFTIPDELGNVHGQLLTGLAGQTARSIGESVTGRLLLGNVHGINAASTVQDAINAGSLNGVANAANQLFDQDSTRDIEGPGKNINENVYE